MSALGHCWQKWQLPTTNQSSKLVRHIVMSSKPMLHIECRNRSPKIDIKTSPRAVKSPGPWLISLCEETPKLRASGTPSSKSRATKDILWSPAYLKLHVLASHKDVKTKQNVFVFLLKQCPFKLLCTRSALTSMSVEMERVFSILSVLTLWWVFFMALVIEDQLLKQVCVHKS